MQIKYKLDYVKQDRHTQIVWHPGLVKNVTAQLGEVLLRHPDVWERVDGDTEDEEIGLPEKAKAVEEPLPVVDFHGMNKETLLEFVEKNYGQRIDKRLAETTVRHKAIAFYSKQQAELG